MSELLAFLSAYVSSRAAQGATPSVAWGTYAPSLTWMICASAMAETTPMLFRLAASGQALLAAAVLVGPARHNSVAQSTLVFPCAITLLLLFWKPILLSKVLRSSWIGYLALSFLAHDVICFLVCTMLYPAPVVATMVDCARERSQALSIPGVSQTWIKSPNGVMLDALTFRPSRATNQWLVYLGGNGEVYEMTYGSQIPLAAKLHVNLAIFNHRGVGRSGGRITRATDLVDDAAAVMQHLMQAEHARQEDIVVFGHSIGGGVASQLVADRFPQMSLVLDRSFSSLTDAAVSLSPLFRNHPDLIRAVVRHTFGDLDSVAAWAKIAHDRKLITFHGFDQIIRFRESSIARLEGSVKPEHIVEFRGPGSDPHNMPSTTFRGHEVMIEKMKDFFSQSPQ